MQNLEQEDDSTPDEAMRVTWVGAGCNVGLAGLKGVVGVSTGSAALVADAAHSLGDLASDAVALGALHISRKPPDLDHPWGHSRFESLGSLGIAALLVGTGVLTFAHSVESLLSILDAQSAAAAAAAASSAGEITPVLDPAAAASVQDASHPVAWAAAAATLSLVAKEALFRWTHAVAERHNSLVLKANAWHHRTDALSSVVALVGIAGHGAGFPYLDPVAGIGVAGMVAKAGVELASESVRKLSDEVDPRTTLAITDAIESVPGLYAVGPVRARPVGEQLVVDARVAVEDRWTTVSSAYQLAERARAAVLERVDGVAEVGVHLRPPPPVFIPHSQSSAADPSATEPPPDADATRSVSEAAASAGAAASEVASAMHGAARDALDAWWAAPAAPAPTSPSPPPSSTTPPQVSDHRHSDTAAHSPGVIEPRVIRWVGEEGTVEATHVVTPTAIETMLPDGTIVLTPAAEAATLARGTATGLALADAAATVPEGRGEGAGMHDAIPAAAGPSPRDAMYTVYMPRWPHASEGAVVDGAADETGSPDGLVAQPVSDHVPLLRPQEAVEVDVRAALAEVPGVEGVSHMAVHYVGSGIVVEVAVEVDTAMRVIEANIVGSHARARLLRIPDIHDADIHLELRDNGPLFVSTLHEKNLEN